MTRVYRFRSDLTPDGGLGSPGGSPILEPFLELEYPNSEKYGSTMFRSRSSPDLGSVGRRSGRITRDSDIGPEFLHRRCCCPKVAFWEMCPGQECERIYTLAGPSAESRQRRLELAYSPGIHPITPRLTGRVSLPNGIVGCAPLFRNIGS